MAIQWIDLYVKAPAGNGYTTSQAMKRIDDHLVQSTPSSFKAPNGLPVQEPDGTWEVRVHMESALGLVKFILTQHYGLEIIREVPHEEQEIEMDPNIEFSYQGVHYTVESRAYDLNRIILPDGRMLEANGWLESYPPQPEGLHEVEHTFAALPPAEIARLMNGVVAEIAA